MNRNVIETILGAVVLVIAGLFLSFAYSSADLKPVKGYELTASFMRLEGIKVGTDVKISGVKIGTVMDLNLDQQTYQAVVKMNIDNNIKLPTDTVATVSSDGLLGDKFIALEPGVEEASFLKAGDKISNTQSPPSLEQLIGKFIYSSGPANKPANDTTPATDATTNAPQQ